jgi:hypothetical protein
MKAHVLTGTREEIAQKLSTIDGDIREVVVVVDEPIVVNGEPMNAAKVVDDSELDMFKEMEPYMTDIDLDNVDMSREAIYTQYPDE